MKNINEYLSVFENNHVNSSTTNPIYKEIVIIGNGPSGIALSYILDGNHPYYNQMPHPDELLTARLKTIPADESLIEQDLNYLASGLEGRSNNPVSLLVDALEHPNADLGYKIPSLLIWKNNGDKKIDHVVLGKGLPGGSWNVMDPHILTLSLGSWMTLPGQNYHKDPYSRTFAGDVAKYYLDYVKQQNLEKYFLPNTIVTDVKVINKCRKKNRLRRTRCWNSTNTNAELISNQNIEEFIKDVNSNGHFRSTNIKDFNSNSQSHVTDTFTNINECVCCRENKKPNKRCRLICCKCCNNGGGGGGATRQKLMKSCSWIDDNFSIYDYNDTNENGRNFATSLPEIKNNCPELSEDNNTVCRILDRSQSFTCDRKNYLNCSKFCTSQNNYETNMIVPTNDILLSTQYEEETSTENLYDDLPEKEEQSPTELCEHDQQHGCCTCNYKWEINGFNCETGEKFTYITKALVLATGSSDRPNKLGVRGEDNYGGDFVLHSLRALEDVIEKKPETCKKDPVLIVGAGLSAADAVIVARNKSFPVLHVFRRKNNNLDKQLPESLYPEYHKVHRMMSDTNGVYPLYTAFPEHSLLEINPNTRQVILQNMKNGSLITRTVSFVTILIGSRPDLNFLPSNFNIGINKQMPIDCKTNPVHINPITHQVLNYDNLYALGPLAGDNFVRFIPGGALAIAADLLKKKTISKNSDCDNSVNTEFIEF